MIANLYERNPQYRIDYGYTVEEDAERHIFLPVILLERHGLHKSFPFSADFFHSGEYKMMSSLGVTLDGTDRTRGLHRARKPEAESWAVLRKRSTGSPPRR